MHDHETPPRLAPKSDQDWYTRARCTLDTVRHTLLGPFAFESRHAEVTALALFLTLHWRPFYTGRSPLFVVESAGPGAGKTALVESLLALHDDPPGRFRGAWPSHALAQSHLLSYVVLQPGVELVHLDARMGETIAGDAIEAALTSPWVFARPPRSSVSMLTAHRATWVLEANAPVLSADVARRSVRTCLLPPRRPRKSFASSRTNRDRYTILDASYQLLRIVQESGACARYFEQAPPGTLTQNPGPEASFPSWYALVYRTVAWLTDEDVFRWPGSPARAGVPA